MDRLSDEINDILTDNYPQTKTLDPFLPIILKNYRQKNLLNDLKPYTSLKKLQSYKLLSHANIDCLQPMETYIKYIFINNAFKDHFYEKHVKAGGILIAGGVFVDKVFKKSSLNSTWTHLMLKFDPSPTVNTHGEVVLDRKEKPHIYFIKIKDCYIFYKKYNSNKRANFTVILEGLR